VRVAILAGGFGTRLAEHTDNIPKPMVPVGGYPIIWHIMKIYAAQGHDDFAVALGYLGNVIKEYFVNYRYHDRSISVDTATGDVKTLNGAGENWRIDLVETGLHTQTKGRVDQICKHIGNEPFMLTYGDGVSDIDIAKLLEFHKSHGKIATITVVRPPARFGAVEVTGDAVTRFEEKPQIGEGWINGGFFVLEPGLFDLIEGDATILEREPLEQAAARDQLMGFRHDGFWHCMDTKRDRDVLEELWQSGQAPWVK